MVHNPASDADRPARAIAPRYTWLTPERQSQLRGVLLGITLFVGLVVWVWHSLGASAPQPSALAHKLRVVGIMTWLYALIQLLDIRFWHSAHARRRRESMGIPDSLIAWLFAQMLAWFGIVYYAFTEDIRWFVAGVFVMLVSFVAFPIRREG